MNKRVNEFINNNQLSELSNNIITFINITNLENPKIYDSFYQNLKNINYLYIQNYNITNTGSLMKNNTKIMNEACKNINETFYEGFETLF